MTSVYDLYGFRSTDLQQVRISVEAALGVKLETHEYSGFGGDYFRLGIPYGKELILHCNFDEIDNERIVDHKEANILLYVNDYENPDDLRQQLEKGVPDIIFIRRDEV